MELTRGHLLDGRISYAQPRTGYRTGLEPVLLAAAVPARPGQSVLEAGCGSGAGLLCLAARVSGVTGLGIDIDPALAALAAANLSGNGFAGIEIRAFPVESLPPVPVYHHAFANPPWHDRLGTPSSDPGRERAKRAGVETLSQWARYLGASLRPRGTLTFVIPAATLPACLAEFSAAGCRSPAILPLWPREATPAKLVLVQAIRGGKAGARLLPGLVLHASDGSFTRAAEAVLRHGSPLPMD